MNGWAKVQYAIATVAHARLRRGRPAWLPGRRRSRAAAAAHAARSRRHPDARARPGLDDPVHGRRASAGCVDWPAPERPPAPCCARGIGSRAAAGLALAVSLGHFALAGRLFAIAGSGLDPRRDRAGGGIASRSAPWPSRRASSDATSGAWRASRRRPARRPRVRLRGLVAPRPTRPSGPARGAAPPTSREAGSGGAASVWAGRRARVGSEDRAVGDAVDREAPSRPLLRHACATGSRCRSATPATTSPPTGTR